MPFPRGFGHLHRPNSARTTTWESTGQQSTSRQAGLMFVGRGPSASVPAYLTGSAGVWTSVPGQDEAEFLICLLKWVTSRPERAEVYIQGHESNGGKSTISRPMDRDAEMIIRSCEFLGRRKQVPLHGPSSSSSWHSLDGSPPQTPGIHPDRARRQPHVQP